MTINMNLAGKFKVTPIAGQKLNWNQATSKNDTGTPPLTRFFGPGKNRVKGKPRYRRSILVLKPKNGEFEGSKSTFSQYTGCLMAK